MELSDEAYRKLVLEVAAARGMGDSAPRRRFSIGGCLVWLAAAILFVVFLAALLPNLAASYPDVPLPFGLRAGPQTTFSTPIAPALAPTVALPPQTRHTPFYAAPVLSGVLPGATATVEPTSGAFWTPAESTALAATATAFIVDIPTAPAEFVAYVDERCRDPEIVAESALLQAWCRK